MILTDTHIRSVVKAISFRIIASLITVILVLIFTGNLALAGAIGILDLILKIIIYYLHERVWDKIVWGRKVPEN